MRRLCFDVIRPCIMRKAAGDLQASEPTCEHAAATLPDPAAGSPKLFFFDGSLPPNCGDLYRIEQVRQKRFEKAIPTACALHEVQASYFF